MGLRRVTGARRPAKLPALKVGALRPGAADASGPDGVRAPGASRRPAAVVVAIAVRITAPAG